MPLRWLYYQFPCLNQGVWHLVNVGLAVILLHFWVVSGEKFLGDFFGLVTHDENVLCNTPYFFSSVLPPSSIFIFGCSHQNSIPPPLNNIPHLPFLLATSSKSLVDRSRFWQNGPASQHDRKETTKNEFLVNFCFELTAQRLIFSDLSPSPKSLVYTRKHSPSHPKKNPVFQDNSPLVSYLFYPHPPNHWLIRGDFARMGQPVNTSGRNQLKTSF
jgi:hypothetical protein